MVALQLKRRIHVDESLCIVHMSFGILSK